MIPIKTDSAWKGLAECQSCGIRDMVLFEDLRAEDFQQMHLPIEERVFQAGKAIYRMQAHAGSLYTIRSGTVKLVRISPDGRERIVRLLRAGAVAGIEALAADSYDSDAVTLTEVHVCRIPVDVVRSLSERSPRIHISLMRKWHQALREADDWLADINFGTAAQRVRQFVMRMRHAEDPSVTTVFSREDMGAMMGLKQETVSRELGSLVKAGVLKRLDTLGRTYRILDAQRLADMGEE